MKTSGYGPWYPKLQIPRALIYFHTGYNTLICISVAREVWVSYQIRNIADCACAGNAGNVFPRRRLQRKQLVSDPAMHHVTCVTHVPWCMSGSLAPGGGENVPGIPGASAIFRIWQEAHACSWHSCRIWQLLICYCCQMWMVCSVYIIPLFFTVWTTWFLASNSLDKIAKREIVKRLFCDVIHGNLSVAGGYRASEWQHDITIRYHLATRQDNSKYVFACVSNLA